jgi:hypothetical protein
MQTDVRYFLLRLSTALMRRGLSGISAGDLGKKAEELCRYVNVGIPKLRAFQGSAEAQKAILQTTDSIEALAAKLSEGDWEKLSTMLNLLDQVTAGQVLVVEKQQYDQLERQYEAENESLSNIPQL